MIISDALSKIGDVVSKEFSIINHQLYVVYLKRNILNRLKTWVKYVLSEELKDIFRTEDLLENPA